MTRPKYKRGNPETYSPSDESRGHLFPRRHALRVSNHWILMCYQCNQDQKQSPLTAWVKRMASEGDRRGKTGAKVINTLIDLGVKPIIAVTKGRKL